MSNGGGGINALGRHTVAALLNSASDNVNYELGESDIVDKFNDVLPGTNSGFNDLKNELEGYNECNCPLN